MQFGDWSSDVCSSDLEHLWYEGKIWVPEDEGLRTTIISRCHDDPLAGHGGIAKTTVLVTTQYYWPMMRKTIKRYIKNCDMCQRSKAVRHAPYGHQQKKNVRPANRVRVRTPGVRPARPVRLVRLYSPFIALWRPLRCNTSHFCSFLCGSVRSPLPPDAIHLLPYRFSCTP